MKKLLKYIQDGRNRRKVMKEETTSALLRAAHIQTSLEQSIRIKDKQCDERCRIIIKNILMALNDVFILEHQEQKVEFVNTIIDKFNTLGINVILPQVGDEFDPFIHECIGGIGGTISKVKRAGWQYKDVTIIYALVECINS